MKVRLFYLNWSKTRDTTFHRATWEGKFFIEHPNLYDLVWQGDIEGEREPEDFLYEKFNIGDREGKRIRSMSVGDVVVYDGKFVVCQGMGWKTYDEPPAWMGDATEVDQQPER